MSRRLAAVPTINPAFHEALGGEFTVASDPDREHTLGRLLIATFNKGELEDLGQRHNGTRTFQLTYRPSWSPEGSMIITGREASDRAQVQFISVGTNEAPLERVNLWDCSVAADPSNAVSVGRPGDERPTRLPLELGAPLETAQDYIARAVELVL